MGSKRSQGEWGFAEPRWATPRNPGRETISGEVVPIMEAMRTPPMPWQRATLDRAMEIDPETGKLWYWEIIITVTRQSGKTTLIVPVTLHRVMAWRDPQLITYVSQTGVAGNDKWKRDMVGPIQRSPFAALIRPNRKHEREPNLTNGHWALPFTDGSTFRPEPPTEDAGHGDTGQLSFMDETWTYVDDRVEQALSPGSITILDAQRYAMSTVGWTKTQSPYLWSKMAAGRARVEAGLDSHTLYVEFSAPEDADWLDEDVWWQTMPALGFTQTLDKVRAEADSPEKEKGFRRAYLNQWGDVLHTDWKIPQDAWFAVEDQDSQPTDTLVWVVDVAHDRSSAAIAMASMRDDMVAHVEVVDYRPGTAWLPDRVAALVDHHGGRDDIWYDHQTVGALVPDLEDAGLEPHAIPARDIQVSGQALVDAVLNKRMAHIGQVELTQALAGAATRAIGDGWAWKRGASMGDICPLVAATEAHWMLLKTMPEHYAIEDSYG